MKSDWSSRSGILGVAHAGHEQLVAQRWMNKATASALLAVEIVSY